MRTACSELHRLHAASRCHLPASLRMLGLQELTSLAAARRLPHLSATTPRPGDDSGVARFTRLRIEVPPTTRRQQPTAPTAASAPTSLQGDCREDTHRYSSLPTPSWRTWFNPVYGDTSPVAAPSTPFSPQSEQPSPSNCRSYPSSPAIRLHVHDNVLYEEAGTTPPASPTTASAATSPTPHAAAAR